nr:E3 ubiquitin-protein ligase MARCH2-like [Ipomoea batatas]
MGDLVIYVGDDDCEIVCGAMCFCRICHEAEFESSKILEAPCGCSGTLKLAHRDCIQRWCNEKGNTICEICLQKFEDGYTAPPPKMLHTPPVTIWESSENPRIEENSRVAGAEDERCSLNDVHKYASRCRIVVLILTFLVLMGHLFELLAGEARRYPFSLTTVVVIKAVGILLPAYLLIRIITLIQNGVIRPHLDFGDTIGYHIARN